MGAQGTTTVNFGAFPGSPATSAAVAQPAILAGSLVEAWLYPVATADHSADEHLCEPIKVIAGDVVAGVGFTIYAFYDSNIFEQRVSDLARHGAPSVASRGNARGVNSGLDSALLLPRTYGQWTVAWVWN